MTDKLPITAGSIGRLGLGPPLNCERSLDRKSFCAGRDDPSLRPEPASPKGVGQLKLLKEVGMTSFGTKTSSQFSAAKLAALVGLPALVLMAGPAHAQSPCGPTTTVQPGDTYFTISQRCDVSVGAIEQANPGIEPHSLQVGQTLELEPGPTAEAEPMPDMYRVEPGDTLAAIAATLGTTLDAIMAANPDVDPFGLQIGQVIRPPEGMPPVPGAPDETEERMQVRGVLTEEGVECQAMRSTDGALYTLIGNVEDYDSGEFVEVRGTSPDVSPCMQGTTIDVDEMRRLG
jgi:LysM repeat protein